jgi:hypothetical protein
LFSFSTPTITKGGGWTGTLSEGDPITDFWVSEGCLMAACWRGWAFRFLRKGRARRHYNSPRSGTLFLACLSTRTRQDKICVAAVGFDIAFDGLITSDALISRSIK